MAWNPLTDAQRAFLERSLASKDAPSALFHFLFDESRIRRERDERLVLALMPDGSGYVAPAWRAGQEKHEIGQRLAAARASQTRENLNDVFGALSYNAATVHGWDPDKASDLGATLGQFVPLAQGHPLDSQGVTNAPAQRNVVRGAPTYLRSPSQEKGARAVVEPPRSQTPRVPVDRAVLAPAASTDRSTKPGLTISPKARAIDRPVEGAKQVDPRLTAERHASIDGPLEVIQAGIDRAKVPPSGGSSGTDAATGKARAETGKRVPAPPGVGFQEFTPEELSVESHAGSRSVNDSGKPKRVGMQFNEVSAEELSVETSKPSFGNPSSVPGGSGHHSGENVHTYSPAEVAIRLRVDWDLEAARPRKVSYLFTAEAARVKAQVTNPSFHKNPALKGESAQSREAAYKNTGLRKGHLAQREAGKVDSQVDQDLGLKKPTAPEVERDLDRLDNVVPMSPNLNEGPAWRAAERRTAALAAKEGFVVLEITPEYAPHPPRLSDGTPIPNRFRRVMKSVRTGRTVEDRWYDNK